MKKEFERIKDLRKELNLTQQEFAEKINISRSNLGNIETNTVGITDRVRNTICNEFNISEYWLRTGDGEMFKENVSDDLFFLLGLKSDELDERSKRNIVRYISLSMEQRMAFNEIMGEIFANN